MQRRGFDCVDMSSVEVVTNNNCLGKEADAKPTPLGEVECTRPADIDCSPGAAASRPVLAAVATDSSVGAEGQQSPAPAQTMAGPVQSSPPLDTPPADGKPPQPVDTSIKSAEADSTQQADMAAVREDTPDSNGVVAGGDTTGGPGPTAAAGSIGNAPQQTYSTGSNGLGMDIGSGGAGSGPGNSTAGAAPTPGVDSSGVSAVDSTSGDSDSTTAAAPTTASSTGGNGAGVLVSVDLGPDPTVPTWLLNDPTPALKTLLECTGGYALSADGKCCAGESLSLGAHIANRVLENTRIIPE